MASTSTEPQLLTTRQAARFLGVSIDTVYRLREDGRLQAVRLRPNAALRFERDALAALVARGREAA